MTVKLQGNNRNTRTYFIVLGATFIAWLVAGMLETKDYPATYRVEYIGYDSARYALISSSDSISLTIKSTGFQTMQRSRKLCDFAIQINLGHEMNHRNDTLSMGDITLRTEQFNESIHEQLHLPLNCSIELLTKQLNLTFAKRKPKVLYPQLDNVDFSFASGYSLAGEPVLEPDSIIIYGSEESLTYIKEISTLPTQIKDLSASGSHLIALDTTWKRYPDLRISQSQIKVYVPVAATVENTISLPVSFFATDTALHAKLYPEQVKITYWISTNDYNQVDPKQFKAVVRYEGSQSDSTLQVKMETFPASIRIKSIEPQTIHYVVIK